MAQISGEPQAGVGLEDVFDGPGIEQAAAAVRFQTHRQRSVAEQLQAALEKAVLLCHRPAVAARDQVDAERRKLTGLLQLGFQFGEVVLWAEFEPGCVTTTGGDFNDEWLALLVQQGLHLVRSPTLDAGMLKVGFEAIKAGLLGVMAGGFQAALPTPEGVKQQRFHWG